VRAVVLVGGLGTRLRPLTLSTPKQMLPVAGVPMIERVLSHVAAHGVEEAVLSLGYLPDAFTDAYPSGRCAGVALQYAVDPEPLDTAGAIRFSALRAGVDATFLVVNGDVLTDLDVGKLVAFHGEAGAEGTIALTPVDDPSHYGVVPTDAGGRVTAFIEKPPPGEAPTNLINAGFYVLEPSVLDRIPDGRAMNVERVTFPAMVADGTLFARADDSYWIDVGTPARYIEACLHFAGDVSAVTDGARIAPTATVEASVVLPGAVVEEGAVVRRSVVGRHAVVGRRARLEDLTVVGDGAVVEPGRVLRGARVPDVGTRA
jgi:mannose-1-phosphate guanylyltransferase